MWVLYWCLWVLLSRRLILASVRLNWPVRNLTRCAFFPRPDLIDMNTVAVQSNLANLEHAFYVAEKIGVIRLLDPEGEVFS